MSASAPMRRSPASRTPPARATCCSWNAPASADIARNIAGAPGREGIDVFAQGDNYLVSAGLYRQEDHRRRHLRRAAGAGRPRLLAGGQRAATSSGCWTATSPMSSSWPTPRPTPAPPTSSASATARNWRWTPPRPSTPAISTPTRSTEFGFETAGRICRLLWPGRLVPLRHRPPHRRCPIRISAAGMRLLTYSLTGEAASL